MLWVKLYTELWFVCLQKARGGPMSPAAAQQKISGLEPVTSLEPLQSTPVDKVQATSVWLDLDLTVYYVEG